MAARVVLSVQARPALLLDNNQATGAAPQPYWQRSTVYENVHASLRLTVCQSLTEPWHSGQDMHVSWLYEELFTGIQVWRWPTSFSGLIPLFLSIALSLKAATFTYKDYIFTENLKHLVKILLIFWGNYFSKAACLMLIYIIDFCLNECITWQWHTIQNKIPATACSCNILMTNLLKC